MAKLLHKRIKVTDGVYSFDFSFHSPKSEAKRS